MASSSENRAKAPQSAAFVNELRAVFGDVKVLYVEEGEVRLGEKTPGPFATCYVVVVE
jgi:hypothetical protein